MRNYIMQAENSDTVFKALWTGVKAFFESRGYSSSQDHTADAMTYPTSALASINSFEVGDYVAFQAPGIQGTPTTHVGKITNTTFGGLYGRQHVIEGFMVNTYGIGWKPQVWGASDMYLRYMLLPEVQDIMPSELNNVRAIPDGTVRAIAKLRASTPAAEVPAVEDRIGLRREEIDWDAHREFMRGL